MSKSELFLEILERYVQDLEEEIRYDSSGADIVCTVDKMAIIARQYCAAREAEDQAAEAAKDLRQRMKDDVEGRSFFLRAEWEGRGSDTDTDTDTDTEGGQDGATETAES